MLSLLRAGHTGEAIVGGMLGLQLCLVAYRFGQHVAVYVFVWGRQREVKSDGNRGGYGSRVKMMADIDEDVGKQLTTTGRTENEQRVDMMNLGGGTAKRFNLGHLYCYIGTVPSDPVCLNSFFTKSEDQQWVLTQPTSLPIVFLVTWRLSRDNSCRPAFPTRTFACNMLACSLDGSLGSLLAGNQGVREGIFLVSFVAGLGGTLSSLATFTVNVLSFYLMGLVQFQTSFELLVGFVFSATVN